LVTAGFCGLRWDELHRQVWEDIQRERQFLRVREPRKVTIQPNLAAWLRVYVARTRKSRAGGKGGAFLWERNFSGFREEGTAPGGLSGCSGYLRQTVNGRSSKWPVFTAH